MVISPLFAMAAVLHRAAHLGRRRGGRYYQICSGIEATLIAQFRWLHRKWRPTLGPEMLHYALHNHA